MNSSMASDQLQYQARRQSQPRRGEVIAFNVARHDLEVALGDLGKKRFTIYEPTPFAARPI